MLETRIAKITMVACLAAFACLVTFDNLTDYDTNFEFVRHVLGIDTTFPGNALLYRRVTSAALWNAAYCLIIFGEGLTGLTLASAAIALLRQLRSGADRFNRAKRFVSIGAMRLPGMVPRLHGLGGEWFQMWQSPSWNGQEAAFRCYLTILAVLIFVHQKDEDFAIRNDEG